MDHLPHICRVYIDNEWHECLSQSRYVSKHIHTHTHTIRLLMFYSSPLMPSSEIDLFLNRNLFQYIYFSFFITHPHTPISHLSTHNCTISKEKKLLQHILKYCDLCVSIGTFAHSSVSLFKLSPGINLCIIFVSFFLYDVCMCVTAKYKYDSQCYHNHWWNEMILAVVQIHVNGGTMKNVLPIYWCGKVTWCLFSHIHSRVPHRQFIECHGSV